MYLFIYKSYSHVMEHKSVSLTGVSDNSVIVAVPVCTGGAKAQAVD